MNVADVRDFSDQARPAKPAKPKMSKRRKLVGWLGEIAFIVVAALILAGILRALVFQVFEIPSGSMQNTLKINDRVIASKINDFKRGDIVVFVDPARWMMQPPSRPGLIRKSLEFVGLMPSSSDNHLIKRVIGLPGDRVQCCGTKGRLSVNGVDLEEDYLYSVNGVPVAPSDQPFDVVVPAGRLFVMGDHRNNSGDSRMHLCDPPVGGLPTGMTAFVPVENVVGPATAVVAPFSRIQRLKTPAAFANIPAPSAPAPERPQITLPERYC